MSKSFVFISGGKKKQQDLIKDTVEWSIRRLRLSRYTLDLDIELKTLKKDYGFCTNVSDDRKPREFLIEINKKKKNKMLVRTVFHEMVHVAQMVEGTFVVDGQKCFWKDELIDEDEVGYKNLPWEKEAFDLEAQLFSEWKIYKKRKKKTK